MKTYLRSFVALAMVGGMMSGCSVDDLEALGDVDGKPLPYHGHVFFADNVTDYGAFTNKVTREEEGTVLYDSNIEFRVGYFVDGGVILDVDGNFVAECIPNESEGEYDGNSFTESGYLQGSCHLDRDVPPPKKGEPYTG
jgi:hypothetical protein